MSRDEIVKAAFQVRDALLTHAFALVRNWTVADDVLQDSFIVVMNKWQDFRPGTSVFLWVRQIVHLKSLEALRARSRAAGPLEDELLERVAASLDAHVGEAEAEAQRTRREALERCMSRLSDRCVGLLAGFYGHSRSCEELADRQHRTANAVRLALSRLRKQLHECVSRQLPALEAGA